MNIVNVDFRSRGQIQQQKMQTMKQVVLMLVSSLRHLSIWAPRTVSGLIQNSALCWFLRLCSAWSLSFEGEGRGNESAPCLSRLLVSVNVHGFASYWLVSVI